MKRLFVIFILIFSKFVSADLRELNQDYGVDVGKENFAKGFIHNCSEVKDLVGEEPKAIGDRNVESVIQTLASSGLFQDLGADLNKDPCLRGEVMLGIHITPSGSIVKTNLLESTITDKKFIEKLIKGVSRAKFKQINNSDNSMVPIKLRFGGEPLKPRPK